MGLPLNGGHPPASPSALRPGDETASESLTLHAHSTTDVSCIYRRHDARVTRLYNRSTSRMDLDKKIIRIRKHFLCGMYISRKLSPSFAPIALSHGFVHLQGAVVVVTDAVDGS